MHSFFEDLAARLADASIVGVAVYLWRLASRVRNLEEHWRATEARFADQEKDANARADRLDTAVASLGNFTALMAKMETLLETGLRRLDIIEKHVFRL